MRLDYQNATVGKRSIGSDNPGLLNPGTSPNPAADLCRFHAIDDL
jgi:hypothetical protein